MIAFLHDLSFLHHHNAVTRSNAAQPMRHDHDAQSLSLRFVLSPSNAAQPMRHDHDAQSLSLRFVLSPDRFHRVLHDFLALRVQRTRRFVQHQNSRVSNQCTCDCNALFLPSRQRASQFAHISVVSFRERSNERIGLHQFRRFHHCP